MITVIFCLHSVSNAALLERDWNTSGDNAILYDSGSGLDWLDLNQTRNLTYNFVSALFGVSYVNAKFIDSGTGNR